MPRPRREPNLRLRALIDEAGLSRKGLARRVNDLGRAKGMSGLSYDHSSVIRWLKANIHDSLSRYYSQKCSR